MVDANQPLIVIPARGGSKRLPRKNVIPLAGKPLICWTIEVALQVGLNARILVSSDDNEILELAEKYADNGVVAHKRPAELASDTATTAEAVIDAVQAECRAGYAPQTLILLQPTSPLRDVSDVLAAVETFERAGSRDTVVSVCEVNHPTAWTGMVNQEQVFHGTDLLGKRSQDYQKEYRLNGAVYVVSVDFLLAEKSIFTKQLRASVMPKNRSFDIDDRFDFKVCASVIDDPHFCNI